jgi:hypothetical protein
VARVAGSDRSGSQRQPLMAWSNIFDRIVSTSIAAKASDSL